MVFAEAGIATAEVNAATDNIKRVNKFNDYQIYQTAAASGMVTFKNPIKHWMSSIEIENKYANVTSSEEEIRSKLG